MLRLSGVSANLLPPRHDLLLPAALLTATNTALKLLVELLILSFVWDRLSDGICLDTAVWTTEAKGVAATWAKFSGGYTPTPAAAAAAAADAAADGAAGTAAAAADLTSLDLPPAGIDVACLLTPLLRTGRGVVSAAAVVSGGLPLA